VSSHGYTERLTYDQLARLSRRSITTDQQYQYHYSYNSIGALDTLTYPTSPVPAGPTGNSYTIQDGYSYGYLNSITDVTGSSPQQVWSLGAANDDGPRGAPRDRRT
jgi:hypothetical protein